MGEYCWTSISEHIVGSSSSVHVTTAHRQLFKMKVCLLSLASTLLLCHGAPVPEADPDPFFNTIALPAITGSALVDGLLLGKVAFLKAAILANLLLGSSGGSDELSDSYGAPVDTYGAPVDSYGAPEDSYGAPDDSYGAPDAGYGAPAPVSYDPAPVATYDAPAVTYDTPAPVETYGAPAEVYAPAETPDSYGAPQADPLPTYGAPSYYF